jgi:tetratricopeptide (TPR) repeat protein
VDQYGREDVLRILRVPARQLVAWQRAGLVQTAETFSFEDLVKLVKLRDLAETRISVKNICRSVEEMKKVAGLTNPLLESVAVHSGRRAGARNARLAFRQWGALVDPVTRQLMFDFEQPPAAGLLMVRKHGVMPARLANEVQEMFLRAVRLEENPATVGEAQEQYEQILELQPTHAPSAINLGTIFYNQREFLKAEASYRRASESDPEYALAFFDLGNVLDELQRLDEAVTAYERALALVPTYADAHYNVALAYERRSEPSRALKHWKQYAQLDPTGPWASHARAQAKKILGSSGLAIVSRHGRTMKMA